jgi:polyhydroxyalkanoate synthesis regulator phasin
MYAFAALSPPPQDRQSGISDALRNAIESTFAATSGSAAETRERAAELLDEVARRGREAGEEVVRRGQEAGGEVVRRGQEAGTEAVGRVEEELRTIRDRLAKVEASLRRGKS